MFYKKEKDESISKLKELNNKRVVLDEKMQKLAIKNFELRSTKTSLIIEELENYINRLSNSPKEFDKPFKNLSFELKCFKKKILKYEQESSEFEKNLSKKSAAGVITGAGIFTLAPSAGMAIATTFGTASTGTTIASLSGAATTNAALAWLGGGTLVAGGGECLLVVTCSL